MGKLKPPPFEIMADVVDERNLSFDRVANWNESDESNVALDMSSHSFH